MTPHILQVEVEPKNLATPCLFNCSVCFVCSSDFKACSMPIKAACKLSAVTWSRLGKRSNIPETALGSLSKALMTSSGTLWRSLENLRKKSITSHGINETNHGRAARVKRTANGN